MMDEAFRCGFEQAEIILQDIYAILQIIYKKFKSIFDTPQQAPVHTKV